MIGQDPTPRVADDDFPEFAEPPRHRPDPSHESQKPSATEDVADNGQDQVDDVIARLRRERSEGTR